MRKAPRWALLVAGLGLLVVSVPRATSAQQVAQSVAGSITGSNGSTKGAAMRKTAQNTPQCMHIITECKSLGFIPGQYKTDNGLWKDCFDPVVMGKGSPTRDGKPVTVPVNASDVQGCKAALGKT
jgi:hypothetical protein